MSCHVLHYCRLWTTWQSVCMSWPQSASEGLSACVTPLSVSFPPSWSVRVAWTQGSWLHIAPPLPSVSGQLFAVCVSASKHFYNTLKRVRPVCWSALSLSPTLLTVSENKVLCHPSSVDSLSTSAATEDHVSMGGWAARKALRVVEHVEQGAKSLWVRQAQNIERTVVQAEQKSLT